MRADLRFLFVAIEVNLLLWLSLLGAFAAGGQPSWSSPIGGVLLVGLIWGAFVQHYAFYRLRKRSGRSGE